MIIPYKICLPLAMVSGFSVFTKVVKYGIPEIINSSLFPTVKVMNDLACCTK
jgi:hypothetical protein